MERISCIYRLAAILAALLIAAQAPAAASAVPANAATAATQAANAGVLSSLPFSDKQDFEDAQRGFIARPDKLTIRDAKGKVVWDLESYKEFIGLDKPAPDDRQPEPVAQCPAQHAVRPLQGHRPHLPGARLRPVEHHLHPGRHRLDRVRSADLDRRPRRRPTTWSIEKLGKRPVHAVIYSHSHVDHYGGVRGIVDEADVESGKVQIIAPEGFTEHAVSENVIAGNAMSRRAVYMYGAMLPRKARRAA